MRKIIVGAQVSMDGVMQAPGGPTEDPTNGFKFGGWSMAYFDQAGGEEIVSLFKDKFDLLLGRKTYEIFAAYWPYYEEDAPHGSVAKAFKDIRKYVVSRSGEVDMGWKGSVLLRDIAEVKRLKQEDGLIVGHYAREGKVKVDDTALGSPSEREISRRERMKREG